MNVYEAAQLAETRLKTPLRLWQTYDPTLIPLAIYDDNTVIYVHHPAPPAERPKRLAAATAMKINDVLTATIPAAMVADEPALIPLIYHEAFHVYQDTGHFQPGETFEFFRVLAYYPELRAEYRALCALEADVLNQQQVSEQGRYLAAIARQKYALLETLPGLLAYERQRERVEGTASYIEQTSRQQIFGIEPGPVEKRYGWSRQYATGAALCRLLSRLLPDTWQMRIEAGESPTDILIAEFPNPGLNLDSIGLAKSLAEETAASAALIADCERRIDAIMSDALTIRWSPGISAGRAFNPSTMLALGDGRVLHQTFLNVYVPQGSVQIQGEALENFDTHELTLKFVEVQFAGGTLTADTPEVKIQLSSVAQTGSRTFQVMNPS